MRRNEMQVNMSLVFFAVICTLDLIVASNFFCQNGESIGANEICNGVANCIDSYDERKELCFSTICESNEFKCHYGGCVHREKFCNKIRDCLDGSDEFNCGKSNASCSSSEFYCSGSSTCIESVQICNGKRDCPNGEDEDICQHQQACPKNTFRCKSGRCINAKSVCDNFNDCISGDDESNLLCEAVNCSGAQCNDNIGCPSIKSHRLNLSCERYNQSVSCGKDVKPGTVVKYSCKEFYQLASTDQKYNKEAICQKNGVWSSEILKCESKCGYLKESLPLIVNGFTGSNIFPWHATIFIKRENDFQFACGGTLVTEYFVLSAAHCFNGLNESDVKVGIAKKFSSITVNEAEEPNAKIFNISQITRHPLYLDKIGNYGQDIALVELSQRVDLSEEVHPICIDYQNDIQVQNQTGIVAGMGVTENDTFSDIVRMTTLQIVSSESCIRSQPKDFQKYITVATFCAGLNNGTSVCNGDSGNGFMALSEDLKTWKIQGIVSLSPRKQSTFYCDPTKFAVFTKVFTYSKWIKFVIDEFESKNSIDTDKILTENEPIFK